MIVEPRDTLLIVTTIPDLKVIAEKAGVIVRGKKAELLDEMLLRLGTDPFLEILQRNRLYVVTEAGRREFESKSTHLSNARARLEREIIEAFADGALTWGLSLAKNLSAVERKFGSISTDRICQARLILQNAVPSEIDYLELDLGMLRAVAASEVIGSLKVNAWPEGLITCHPKIEDVVLTPRQFGRALLGD